MHAPLHMHMCADATVHAHARSQGMLARSLWRTHARTFLWTGALKVVHDAVMFSQPYILEQLLKVLGGRGAPFGSRQQRLDALGLAFAILGAALLEALLVTIYVNALVRCSAAERRAAPRVGVCLCVCGGGGSTSCFSRTAACALLAAANIKGAGKA